MVPGLQDTCDTITKEFKIRVLHEDQSGGTAYFDTAEEALAHLAICQEVCPPTTRLFKVRGEKEHEVSKER